MKTNRFRVWNGTEYIGKYSIGEVIDPDDYESFDDLIFEQYVGVCDKEETSVYEGDLCKINIDGTDRIGVVKFLLGSYVLLFKNGYLPMDQVTTDGVEQYYVLSFSKGFLPLFTTVTDEMTVVGNIRENSELLDD